FSSRRRHTRSYGDWSSDVCSSDLSTSSTTKGETLLDTARNLQAMAPDVIVLRHASSGAPHFIARHVDAAVINAGDGTHEHPTQEIGRASCRERVQSSGVGRSMDKT